MSTLTEVTDREHPKLLGKLGPKRKIIKRILGSTHTKIFFSVLLIR